MYGTGFLPADAVNIYRTDEDDLYLVGTAEVPLAALHMGEILDEAQLPVRYAGYSTCFRREAGSYGKDLRRDVPRAPVRQGRDVHVHRAGGEPRDARVHPERRGEDPRQARDPLPGREHRGRRPRRPRGQEVRHRGMAPRPGQVPRADELLEHDRLPGAAAADAHAPRRWLARDAPHAERHGHRDRAHADRDPREPPARGRLGRDPEHLWQYLPERVRVLQPTGS